jgi:hypothetical protein
VNDKKELSVTPIQDSKDGEVMVVKLYYQKGGANYFSGGVNPRGYYLSAQPEKRGNGSRSFVAFSGTSMVIKQVKRFNQREFDALVPEQADIDKLTAHVMAKRPKQSEAA